MLGKWKTLKERYVLIQIFLNVTRTAYHCSTTTILTTVILMQTAPTPKAPFSAPVWMDIRETVLTVLVRHLFPFKWIDSTVRELCYYHQHFQFKFFCERLEPRSHFNLRSSSIFVSLCHSLSLWHGETKREPDTNLLRNVCRPLFWLIDICRISQPKLLPLLVFLVCKFFTRGKNADWLT